MLLLDALGSGEMRALFLVVDCISAVLPCTAWKVREAVLGKERLSSGTLRNWIA